MSQEEQKTLELYFRAQLARLRQPEFISDTEIEITYIEDVLRNLNQGILGDSLLSLTESITSWIE